MMWRLHSIIILFAAFAVVVALVLAGLWHIGANRGPSCEERGGQRVFTHFAINTIMVGKVLMPISNPQYRCDGAKY